MKKIKSLVVALFCAFSLCLGAGILTVNTASAEDPIMAVSGVGMRVKTEETDTTGNGVRFGVTITKEEHAKIATGEIKETGILVIPTDKLGGAELDVYTADSQRRTTQNTWVEYTEDTTKMQSYAYLYNIPAEYYNRPISWRGYCIYSDDTIEYSKAVSRSVADVAVTARTADDYDTIPDSWKNAINGFLTADVTYNYNYREDGEVKTETTTINYTDVGLANLSTYKLDEPTRKDYVGTWDYDFNRNFLGSAEITATAWEYTGTGYKLDTLDALNNAADFAVAGVGGNVTLTASDKDGYVAKYSHTGEGEGKAAILAFNFNGLEFDSNANYELVIKAYVATNMVNVCANYGYAVTDSYVNWIAQDSEKTISVPLNTTKNWALANGDNFVLNNLCIQGFKQNSYEIHIASIEIKKNVAGTTFAAPTYFDQAKDVSVPLDAASKSVFVRDNGEYLHVETSNVSAPSGTKAAFLTVNYDNITLKKDTQIIIQLKQYPIVDGTNVAYMHILVNGEWFTWTDQAEKTFTYTATADMTLSSISFASQNSAAAWAVTFSFDVYNIKIVEKVNVAGTTLATPTYFKEANEVSIPLDAATYAIYAKDNGEYFNYESTASIGNYTSLLKITYDDLVLNAGDKIVLTLKMHNSSTVNFNLNGVYADWFSDSTSTATVVTKEISIKSATTLSTLEFTAGKGAQVHIFDVYGIEIVRA